MSKRNWPNHNSGPTVFKNSDLSNTDVTFIGTLKLRIKYPEGYEEWLPPTEAQSLVVRLEDENGVSHVE